MHTTDSILPLLRRLLTAKVDFIVVGGMAGVFHGSPLVTSDLDVCAPLSEPVCRAIIRAFADTRPTWRMRPDLPVITEDHPVLPELKHLYMRTTIGDLDVMGELQGICSYEELLRRSVEMDFEGTRLRVIDLDTLIAAKRNANRLKDRRALPYLMAIKKEREKLGDA